MKWSFDGCKMLDQRIGRSSRPEVFWKKGVLTILQNSQESACATASFFKKVTSLRDATLINKGLWHR